MNDNSEFSIEYELKSDDYYINDGVSRSHKDTKLPHRP